MRIAVIGGKLQGLEATYLAIQAGYDVTLVDRKDKKDLPAAALCDSFIHFEFSKATSWPENSDNIDLIFPALEDVPTLELLAYWAAHLGVPIVLDLHAYRVSSSKLLSNALFTKLKLPRPGVWPKCSFPVIVKPDMASGSKEVVLIKEKHLLQQYLETYENTPVIEEYLEGPSFSIEVIGKPGNYVALQVTELFIDAEYDCCAIQAPAQLSSELQQELKQQILKIAEALSLHGIMDLEVILHKGQLKILEIDARFPSQTPMTVYHSTGINMVELLAQLFIQSEMIVPRIHKKSARMEHIKVSNSKIEFLGEHIIGESNDLSLQQGFFGSTVSLTNYAPRSIPSSDEWVSTLIFEGNNQVEIEKKRTTCLKQIASAIEV